MPTQTYTPLANITLSAETSLITFSSISQSYRDLILIAYLVSPGTENMGLRFNTDTGSNYTSVSMQGTGSSTFSGTTSSSYIFTPANFTTANSTSGRVFSTVQFMDYSATDKHKTVLSRSGNTYDGGTEAVAARWASTSAISTIKIHAYNGWNFTTGSTFALYGIAA